MPRTSIAAVSALAGGVLWLLFAVLGGTGVLADMLHLVGWILLMLAAAVFGSGLIRAGGNGQRIFVGVGFAVLILLAVEAFRTGDTPWYDAAWGGAAVLVGGATLLRAR